MQFPLVALGTQAAGLLQYLGKPNAGAAAKEPGTAFSLAADPPSPWQELLARYDLRRITPRRFGELVQELQRRGMLSPEEYQLLAGLRLELEQQGYRTDQPLDLLRYLEDRLRKAQQEQLLPGKYPAEQEAAVQAIQQRLLWAQRFEQLRAESSGEPDR